MLTRKHFEAIAQVLREHKTGAFTAPEQRMVDEIARDLARYLATTNPNFNAGRFKAAAGVCDA